MPLLCLSEQLIRFGIFKRKEYVPDSLLFSALSPVPGHEVEMSDQAWLTRAVSEVDLMRRLLRDDREVSFKVGRKQITCGSI